MSDLDEIKKYKMLVESAIVESYEDRVAKVVKDVITRFSTGHADSKEQLLSYINNALEWMNIPDARAVTVDGKPSNAKKEFIKDVLAGLKGKIKIKKKEAPEKESVKDKIEKLARIIQKYTSDTFPDGDPIDSIRPAAIKAGFDDESFSKYLDKAARILGSKTYYDYLADVWDQIKTDNPDFPGIQDKNPWRS